VVFISHGAEERGLFGSRYYAAHPTLPISSLVAVLNGDMIGRNATDTASLMGSTAPHRNSIDLAKMAMEANREGPKFVIDSSWDVPGHVEFWYFRSDHVPYARLGIPSIMFSSNLHSEYHTPLDKAENINYPKVYKMTQWMYRTGWKVANADKRPGGDPQFKLER
jgi:Zn-dependent M28 family amino/carboxypeptidase